MSVLGKNREWAERTSVRPPSLDDNERVFDSLFERSADAIWLYEVQGQSVVLVDCNQAAVELLGAQNKKQLLHTRPENMSPQFQPDGTPSARKAEEITAIVQRQKTHRFEWALRRLDGKIIPLEVSVTSVIRGGKHIHVGISRDISERMNAERELVELNQSLERRVSERTAALSASEAKFRALFEESSQGEAELRASEARLRESEARFSAAFRASPVSIVIFRMDDSRCVLANESFLKWAGYRLNEVLGRTTLELGIWEDPAERASLWQELRRTKSIHERECRLTNRRGQSFIMLISAEVIEINGVPQALTVGVDITERKRAQAALAESEARFSVAFHASPALIGILRVNDGKYVLVNDAHLNWLGCSREEVLGRTCLELGMWADTAERDSLLQDLSASGSVRQRECRWRNRHGEQFTVLLSAETISLNDTPHMLLMALDITKRKNAEVETLKALTREKELSQLKSNFVSMVSHEFRTPLGIIQSSSELLRDFQGRMQPNERDEQLQSIVRNTRRMAGMMEEVLVLSRLDAGKLIFQPATLDLNVFFRHVVDEVLSTTSRRCPIELSLKSVPSEAQADERLLGHIFTNLLSNAVKYSEAGATVYLTVEPQKGKVVCVVRDQGIGISEEDQQQLFSAFHRGSNVGTRPGTGLGLLLVKRCAELHGGKVQVHSRIGQGTTVTVSFPVFRNKA